MVSFCPEMLVVNRHVETNNVRKQVNNVTFFRNKLKCVKRSQILFHIPTLDMYWTWLSTKKSKIYQ